MESQSDDRTKSLDLAVSQIERQFGKGSIMKLGDREHIEVPMISTTSLSVDYALGVGGIPRGRMTEIFGPESSGKTTLALHVVAEAQKQGGVAAFIDAEHALDPEYARKLGVDVDNLMVSQPDCGEQALEITEILIRSGAMDVVVIDSVAALVPKAELDGDMGDSFVGLHARLMSQAMRKLTGIVAKSRTSLIFINQLREKIGAMFGNPEVTTGGRALKFYASLRLDIRRIGAIKDGEQTVGNRTKLRVVKNKIAAPFRLAEFDIMYGEGISREGDLLDLGVAHNTVEKSGSWYSYGEIRLGQGRAGFGRRLRDRAGYGVLLAHGRRRGVSWRLIRRTLAWGRLRRGRRLAGGRRFLLPRWLGRLDDRRRIVCGLHQCRLLFKDALQNVIDGLVASLKKCVEVLRDRLIDLFDLIHGLVGRDGHRRVVHAGPGRLVVLKGNQLGLGRCRRLCRLHSHRIGRRQGCLVDLRRLDGGRRLRFLRRCTPLQGRRLCIREPGRGATGSAGFDRFNRIRPGGLDNRRARRRFELRLLRPCHRTELNDLRLGWRRRRHVQRPAHLCDIGDRLILGGRAGHQSLLFAFRLRCPPPGSPGLTQDASSEVEFVRIFGAGTARGRQPVGKIIEFADHLVNEIELVGVLFVNHRRSRR